MSKTVNPFGIFWIALHFGHFWWQYLSYSPLCSPSQTSWGDECCLLPACRGVGWHGPHGPSAESWRCVGWPKSLDLFNTDASQKKKKQEKWMQILTTNSPFWKTTLPMTQIGPASILSFFSIDVVLNNVWGVRVQTITASTSDIAGKSLLSEILQHLLNSWSWKWWHGDVSS